MHTNTAGKLVGTFWNQEFASVKNIISGLSPERDKLEFLVPSNTNKSEKLTPWKSLLQLILP